MSNRCQQSVASGFHRNDVIWTDEKKQNGPDVTKRADKRRERRAMLKAEKAAAREAAASLGLMAGAIVPHWRPAQRPKSPFFLSDVAKEQLRSWSQEHLDSPYPSAREKEALAQQAGLENTQVEDYFRNYRRRHWETDLRKRWEQHGISFPTQYYEYRGIAPASGDAEPSKAEAKAEARARDAAEARLADRGTPSVASGSKSDSRIVADVLVILPQPQA